MNRLVYNRAIVNKLKELIKLHPYLRFGQLLVDCDIVETLGDGFAETFFIESEEIWNNMLKNTICFPNEQLS